MPSLPFLPPPLQTVLTTTAAVAARATGFVQRRSKLTGPLFAQLLVFGWLNRPHSSLGELVQMGALLGVTVRPQSLDARFGPAAAAFLERLVEAAVVQVLHTQPVLIPLLQRFRGVFIQDSTTITLPDALAALWRGNGGNTPKNTAAAVKLQLRLDLSTGTLLGPLLQEGRAHDRSSPVQHTLVPPGALRIADQGYFSLPVLADLDRQGAFWLTRLFLPTHVFDRSGRRLALLRFLQAEAAVVDAPIRLGADDRLPCRLLAWRVPPDVAEQRRRRLREEARIQGKTVSAERLALAAWTILVTNVPPALLSAAEALVLLRARWQIELVIKLWKTGGGLDQGRTADPWRILCEVYAKLLALLIQHWLLVGGAWSFPERSLVQAAQAVRRFAPVLALALGGMISESDLPRVLEALDRMLATARMNRRKTKPNTYQLLLDPSLGYQVAA
jgi:Transposase DDE domain